MKKTKLSVSMLFVLFFAVATSVSAFWPFDSRKGQVQGVTTSGSGFLGIWESFLHQFNFTLSSTPTPVPTIALSEPTGAAGGGFFPIGSSENTGAGDQKARLDAAVAAGKITQAQEAEILNMLAAIRAKQQELAQLQSTFYQWLKNNHISTSIFSEPHPSVIPLYGPDVGHVTGASGQIPPHQYYYHPTGTTGVSHTEPTGGASVHAAQTH